MSRPPPSPWFVAVVNGIIFGVIVAPPIKQYPHNNIAYGIDRVKKIFNKFHMRGLTLGNIFLFIPLPPTFSLFPIRRTCRCHLYHCCRCRSAPPSVFSASSPTSSYPVSSSIGSSTHHTQSTRIGNQMRSCKRIRMRSRIPPLPTPLQ